VHSLSRLCTSIHPLRLFSAFIPSVHHVHLDPSIAPLYLLRYSTADPLNSLSTFRANPPHRPRRTLRPTDRNTRRTQRLQYCLIFPAWLVVPSTLLTWSSCGKFCVPIPRVFMALGSIKLCVAPLLRSASVLVSLCHRLTVIEIVIESFFILYMVATVARAATFSTWQSKNPPPYHVHQGTRHALPRS
jgi:hypothetical protein